MTALQRSILLECSTSGRRAPASPNPWVQNQRGRSIGPRHFSSARWPCGAGSGADGLSNAPGTWSQSQKPDLSKGTFAFVDNAVGFLPRLRPASDRQRTDSDSAPLQGSEVSPREGTGPAAAAPPIPRQPAPSNSKAPSSNGHGNGSRAAQPRAASTQAPQAESPSSAEPKQGAPGSQEARAQDAITRADSVAEALARAQDAITRAESSLGSIEDLPSARPPNKYAGVLKLLRTGVIVGAFSLALVLSHAFGLVLQLVCSIAASAGVAWWGYNRSSLSMSGAIAAMVVGSGTIGCSLRFGATLLAFFFSSSKLTQFKEELKDGLDDSFKAGGQRDWKQVVASAAVPTVIAIAYGITVGCVDVPLGAAKDPVQARLATLLAGAFLGYYATCCGDTWASELGPLSSDTPRLITTMRPVRRGTNGGVTLLGLSASILGGMFIGAVFYAAAIISPTLSVLNMQSMAVGQWRLIPLGLMAGLVGSVLDSFLGATLQYTGFNRVSGRVTSTPGPDVTHISGVSFLTNNMVNMLSSTLTAGLTALAALHMFGG